ncbi:hypothetical protein P4519_09710, partial [Geobacillus stearothermophilus]|nr:hypothetical protein [Geobacillus stearothermophilus]
GESPFCMTFAFFYRASLGGPDERREQKFATLVGDHFGMSPTNILLTRLSFFQLVNPVNLQCINMIHFAHAVTSMERRSGEQ